MGTTTTNYNLNKPAKGKTDGGTKLNDNFDTIDSNMGGKIWDWPVWKCQSN